MSTNESDYSGETEIYSCEEFFALNLTLADLPKEAVVSEDACGFHLLNSTELALHPTRYLHIVAYPLLLLLCSIGNSLIIIAFARYQLEWTKKLLLLALAMFDLLYMWAQLFPYLGNFEAIARSEMYDTCSSMTVGLWTFLLETFMTSSDWALVIFSVDRLLAVRFPVWYRTAHSKTAVIRRTFGKLLIMFTLVLLCSSFTIVDYYWFKHVDDPRCPAILLPRPFFLTAWRGVYDWLTLGMLFATFIVIAVSNTVVMTGILSRNRGRELQILRSQPSAKPAQATKILSAAVILYLVTQLPTFVYNIILVLERYPICAYQMPTQYRAPLSRVCNVLINLNYALNCFVYSFASGNYGGRLKKLLERMPQIYGNEGFKNVPRRGPSWLYGQTRQST